jgi:predicted ATPase
MRIAFCGAQNTGKTTLIKDFLVCWPQYKTLNKSYRDVILEKGLNHSSDTTQETQQIIRDWMFDNLKSKTKDDNIVYDRCLLDNLIYTLWSYKYKPGSIDGKFVDETIEMTKESMRNLDIVFYIPADKCNFGIVDDSFRDTNARYRSQIDQLFKGIIHEYTDNYDSDVFWPKNDSPGVIEISGTREQRLIQFGDYIQPDGTLYGEEHSILNPEQLNLMETILKEQQGQLDFEKEMKSVTLQ